MFSRGKYERDRHVRQKKLRDQSKSEPEEEIKEYLQAKKAQKASSERFVWWKKIGKDVEHGKPLDQLFSIKAQKRRHREKMAELEKLKKAKEKRAAERARHEEDMALLARERSRAELQDWEKKEEEFCFDQSKVRSKIRLRQGRAKPIDVLYKHLHDDSESDDMEIELSSEPYMVFKGLTVQDLEELRDDIKTYLDSDRETSTRVKYWESLLVVCDWELTEARKRDAIELLAQEKGLHSGVEADVRRLLDGKTHSELVQMQLHIESQLFSGVAKVVEYWEAVLKLLDIYKAKACLKEIHAETMIRHVHRLENVSSDPEEESFSQEEADDMEAEEAACSFSPELMHGDYDREEAIDSRGRQEAT
ncbi:unnamed protein product [Microthlaspi erraticum]|uniref:Splicing factor cactin central domain-containing protein n=1 Tax=Microthlaspi erraticum TaxID=1685480 RepID=A0A6D2K318_9BRAS|nr:unnamed protein product [Microthlaspi erraticum]